MVSRADCVPGVGVSVVEGANSHCSLFEGVCRQHLQTRWLGNL